MLIYNTEALDSDIKTEIPASKNKEEALFRFTKNPLPEESDIPVEVLDSGTSTTSKKSNLEQQSFIYKIFKGIKKEHREIPTSEIKKLEKNDVVDEIEDMANNVNYYVEAGKWGKASELARALSEYSYKCAKECESTDWAFSVMLKSTYSYWNLAANNYNYLAVEKGK